MQFCAYFINLCVIFFFTRKIFLFYRVICAVDETNSASLEVDLAIIGNIYFSFAIGVHKWGFVLWKCLCANRKIENIVTL